MLLWPAVTVLGFAALAALVIVLGRKSTARYDAERSRSAPASGPVTGAVEPAAGGLGGRPVHGSPGARPGDGAAADLRVAEPTAVGVAEHPADPAGALSSAAAAWWLVEESEDASRPRITAGPFADRIEAEWAALAGGRADAGHPAYGVERTGGALLCRQSTQERAWLDDLQVQLDRLSEDWHGVLTDADPLTTLVVEVCAALTEAGLPLVDAANAGISSGGVWLTPASDLRGVVVRWLPHDRTSVQQVRGAAVHAAVEHAMDAAIADVLVQMGFAVQPLGSGRGCTVTAVRHP